MIKYRKEGESMVASLYQLSKLNTLFTGMIESQLTEILCEERKTLYFDLEKIKFIDSAGFDMIVRISEKAQECGTEFILCNITEEVKELIQLLKLEEKLKFEQRQFNTEALLLEVE